ncbi:MAG: hypothetical protein HQK79_10270 [Desulfobacterales bacterium]|nr:hypothetical protein [Desulfobacterales bacterium]MBF0398595.1 hypothetical protein [Desulfobacterales bacterium]
MENNKIYISKTWDGKEANSNEKAEVEFFTLNDSLMVFVKAPFHGNNAPFEPAGSLDKLWEYEVVELFLIGDDLEYLEIELGPHGHYLVLQLKGIRQIVRKGLEIDYRAEISGNKWSAVARIPISYLPQKINCSNAYAIHGEGEKRRYLAAFPLGGEKPDFHRIDVCLGIYKDISFLK